MVAQKADLCRRANKQTRTIIIYELQWVTFRREKYEWFAQDSWVKSLEPCWEELWQKGAKQLKTMLELALMSISGGIWIFSLLFDKGKKSFMYHDSKLDSDKQNYLSPKSKRHESLTNGTLSLFFLF